MDPFSSLPKNKPFPQLNPDLISLSDFNSAALINRGLTEADTREHFDDEDLLELGPVDSLKELATYAFAKFCSISVVNPLSVASTALQVQYLPSDEWLQKENAENEGGSVLTEEDDEEYFAEDEMSREDSDAEFSEDIYGFSTKNPTTRAFADSQLPSSSTDHLGYVVPTDADIENDAVRPVYQLPPIENGVWDAVKTVVKHPTEGWKGLQKGTLTTWLHQMAQILLQPSLETLLNDSFGIQDEDYLDLTYSDNKPMIRPDLPTVVFSSAVVGWVLSPLELVKTRLIVQTSSPAHRKYNGVIDCLKTTIAEEGLHHLYMDSTLLVPTLLTHTLLPLIAHTRRFLIASIFNVNQHENPFLHSLADLTFSMMELLITLPLETVRKRLQVQRRVRVQQGKAFSSCVQLSGRPYKGVWDCVQRIIREEGGVRDSSRRRRKRKASSREEECDKGARTMGVFGWRKYRGLYKGSTVKFGANLTVFVINILGGSDVEAEW